MREMNFCTYFDHIKKNKLLYLNFKNCKRDWKMNNCTQTRTTHEQITNFRTDPNSNNVREQTRSNIIFPEHVRLINRTHELVRVRLEYTWRTDHIRTEFEPNRTGSRTVRIFYSSTPEYKMLSFVRFYLMFCVINLARWW